MGNILCNNFHPRVSVIIPTYNRARLLPKAIDSVLQQTYRNIEIIVIDDGSTDNTMEVLAPYHDQIVFLKSDHRGTASARNKGMKKASGEYIAFLDSDDIYLPYKIELEIDFILKHPSVGMVFTEFSGKYENGFIDDNYMRNYHLIWKQKGWRYEDVFSEHGLFNTHLVERPIDFFIGNIFKYVIQDSLIPSNTILFHKKVLDVVGYQNILYRFAQEYEFVVRICKHCPVGFLDIPTYVLYIHKDQSTAFHETSTKGKIGLLKEIYMCSVQKNAIFDWAYKDDYFYQNNKTLVDACMNELQFFIGKCWLKYGDVPNARKCFYESFGQNTILSKSCLYWIITFLPKSIQQILDQSWLVLKRFHSVERLSTKLH